eukprot:scaffold50_cov162-Ochromonas_danica.AAC.10
MALAVLGEIAYNRQRLLASPRHAARDIFVFFLGRGEYLMEGFCLAVGIAFLYTFPGIAALRCFRVFRLLWLSEKPLFRTEIMKHFSPVVGQDLVDRVFCVCTFSIRSLSALGDEMFRLTAQTRGGLFLMLVLFYMAYVLGLVLWIETDDESISCGGLGSCMYMMLRLTLFDGDGLTYAYNLTHKHRFLFFLTMAYMCVTAFGVINGLIGIFGTVFARAAEQSWGGMNRNTLETQHEDLAGGDKDHLQELDQSSRGDGYVGVDYREQSEASQSGPPPALSEGETAEEREGDVEMVDVELPASRPPYSSIPANVTRQQQSAVPSFFLGNNVSERPMRSGAMEQQLALLQQQVNRLTNLQIVTQAKLDRVLSLFLSQQELMVLPPPVRPARPPRRPRATPPDSSSAALTDSPSPPPPADVAVSNTIVVDE